MATKSNEIQKLESNLLFLLSISKRTEKGARNEGFDEKQMVWQLFGGKMMQREMD